MSQLEVNQTEAGQTEARMHWTTADLELLPENGKRYEIIDGELLVTRAPRWTHQRAISRICSVLEFWSDETGLGEVVPGAGIIFTDSDNVIPDVVWISKERLSVALDRAEHLTIAPELVVEVVSPGAENDRRDRQLKLRLYSVQGVQEYWIVDLELKQIQIYRRENVALVLATTLLSGDQIVSPLLPGFNCTVNRIFS
ncbi:MAG: Uma2 family endonuclease [Myxacorys chilensis ATA2-1-KO14]|jgi:Uma2 family endonuclease|nr:Uma2 family endonuclease [Myxacorys chilensis ATA2-1-KO14]